MDDREITTRAFCKQCPKLALIFFRLIETGQEHILYTTNNAFRAMNLQCIKESDNDFTCMRILVENLTDMTLETYFKDDSLRVRDVSQFGVHVTTSALTGYALSHELQLFRINFGIDYKYDYDFRPMWNCYTNKVVDTFKFNEEKCIDFLGRLDLDILSKESRKFIVKFNLMGND